MAITGQETIAVVSKSYIGQDDYGNPVEVHSTREVKNVLIANSSSLIDYQISQDALTVDIMAFLPAANTIKLDDEIIYKGKNYKQTAAPDIWRGPKRSIIKPKLILFLKLVD
jgi:hypothetical protein